MTQVAVIMAGGGGERFWPMSRSSHPKGFLKLFSENSMIRETFLRLRYFLSADRIFVVTSKDYTDKIHEEIPEIKPENIITEPFPRDTASAIGLAAITIQKYFPDAIMFICASDHLIKDHKSFKSYIEQGYKIVKQKSCLLTMGILPIRPEIGYGYIEIDDVQSDSNIYKTYSVKQFVEKPDFNTACQYLRMGNYLWNSGMFIFKVETILDEISQHMPELYQGLINIKHSLNTSNQNQVIENVFNSLKKISIDYGIMEKTNNLLCLKLDLNWDDVGSWTSLSRCLIGNSDNNILNGNVLTKDSKDSVILGDNESVIAVIGLDNIIVVKTKDAFLVCNKSSEQEIKKILGDMKESDNLKPFL